MGASITINAKASQKLCIFLKYVSHRDFRFMFLHILVKCSAVKCSVAQSLEPEIHLAKWGPHSYHLSLVVT